MIAFRQNADERNVPEFGAGLISDCLEPPTDVLTRQGERNDGVFRAMIGPKQFTVESQ